MMIEDEADCPGIKAKGMHLWVEYRAPITGEAKICCYFCGRSNP